jgi:adenylyl- and sulfurtransferase ThiI
MRRVGNTSKIFVRTPQRNKLVKKLEDNIKTYYKEMADWGKSFKEMKVRSNWTVVAFENK